MVVVGELQLVEAEEEWVAHLRPVREELAFAPAVGTKLLIKPAFLAINKSVQSAVQRWLGRGDRIENPKH